MTIDMKLIFVQLVIVCFLFACKSENTVEITVLKDTVSHNYLGNGVEWDPYDEAESWGHSVSEDDWNKLFKRLDFMKPQYVRCMINSPYRYFISKDGSFDKTRNINSISRLLRYCTDRNITVIFGEYNPPTFDMKDSEKWVDMSVAYLKYLVCDLGFTCIKYFNIFNEPDGDWASTNGDYLLWKKMLFLFHKKISEYPMLAKQVKLAAPDVVMDYHNSNSEYDAEGWLMQTIADADDIIGVYDLHAYPGQAEVRSGSYSKLLASYKNYIPSDKQIILGEAGYKYWRTADSLLMAEYNRRLVNHPYTKGTDCNMLCYDYFYGLDMPLLAMEVMNAGYSGLAMWMLDDAMHSNGDSGKPEDIKIWGMWNILGEEVFNSPKEEELRPSFYTWSLMCRYFPSGADILKTEVLDGNNEIYAVAGMYKGKLTVAIVNIGKEDKKINLSLPKEMTSALLYVYEEEHLNKDENGFPLPVQTGMKLNSYSNTIKSNSFIILTDLSDE